jgi:hypothetical protein
MRWLPAHCDWSPWIVVCIALPSSYPRRIRRNGNCRSRQGALGWDPPLLIGHFSGCGSNTILWVIACHVFVALVKTAECSRGMLPRIVSRNIYADSLRPFLDNTNCMIDGSRLLLTTLAIVRLGTNLGTRPLSRHVCQALPIRSLVR